MKKDVVIIGAGPAGIFTALEMLRKGSGQSILIVEKGQAIENRRCPKAKTGRCMNCKPCSLIASAPASFAAWMISIARS